MTAPSPETIEREKDKLLLTDAELIRKLGAPEKLMRDRLPELRSKHEFPAPDPLFGDRCYWPLVRRWFRKYYGIDPQDDL